MQARLAIVLMARLALHIQKCVRANEHGKRSAAVLAHQSCEVLMHGQLFRHRRSNIQADEVHAHLATVRLTWLPLRTQVSCIRSGNSEQAIYIRSGTAQCTSHVLCFKRSAARDKHGTS